MDGTQKNKIINAIMERKLVNQTFMSVCKLLDLSDTKQFANVCINRILRDNLLDDQFIHVLYNHLEDDILVDFEGIKKIEYILKGYMPTDMVDELEEWVYLQDGLVEAMNEQVEFLRNADKKVLKNLLFKKAVEEDICDLIRAELKARRQINKLLQSLRKGLYRIKLHFLSGSIIFGLKFPAN